MPTLFVWPPGSGNISRTAAEANAKQVTGPYRFEIVEGVHQPILQAAPEVLTPMLLEHLAEWVHDAPAFLIGLARPELRELRLLRDENARLKRLVADLTLDKQILSDVVKKKI